MAFFPHKLWGNRQHLQIVTLDVNKQWRVLNLLTTEFSKASGTLLLPSLRKLPRVNHSLAHLLQWPTSENSNWGEILLVRPAAQDIRVSRMVSEKTAPRTPNLNLKLQKQDSSQQLPTWMSWQWVCRERGTTPIPSSTPRLQKMILFFSQASTASTHTGLSAYE